MNKLMLPLLLLIMGCSGSNHQDNARAECADKGFGDVCREATCGTDFNGYVPRGVCMATDIGKACVTYGPEESRRVYCASDKDQKPLESCQLLRPTGQAICKAK